MKLPNHVRKEVDSLNPPTRQVLEARSAGRFGQSINECQERAGPSGQIVDECCTITEPFGQEVEQSSESSELIPRVR